VPWNQLWRAGEQTRALSMDRGGVKPTSHLRACEKVAKHPPDKHDKQRHAVQRYIVLRFSCIES
jgi:hypothetical protein